MVAIRLQLPYTGRDAFVREYAINMSAAGMFIAALQPPSVGSVVRFEVVLADHKPILRGEGQVVFTTSPSSPAPPGEQSAGELSGFGLRFTRLSAESQGVLAQVLAFKTAHPALFFAPVADPYSGGDALAPLQGHPLLRPADGRHFPAPSAPAGEEAALQALLVPTKAAPLPIGADAARLLDELLSRRAR
jgi:uncharacterized protein (TIGR02266 family)